MNQKATFVLRSGSRKSAPVPDANAHPVENLADWLQEAARRPWVAEPVSINPAGPAEAGPIADPMPVKHRYLQNARELTSLAVLTIGYLQYYCLDVMVQIGNLQKVVFFVPLAIA